MRISSKLISLSVGVLVLTGITAGVASYKFARDEMQFETQSALTAVRETKKREIEFYFNQQQELAKLLALNSATIDAMRQFSSAFASIPHGGAKEPQPGTELGEYYAKLAAKLGSGMNMPVGKAMELVAPADPRTVFLQQKYVAGSKTAPSSPAYDSAHARYHKFFEQVREKLGFYDIFLIDDVTGYVVYTVMKESDFASNLLAGANSTTNLADSFRAIRGAQNEVASFMDFKLYPPSLLAPAAFISTGIFEQGSDRKFGTVVVQIPIDRINAVMTGGGRWTEEGLGLTGETYLAGPDFTMRSDSRFLLQDKAGYLERLTGAGVPATTVDAINLHSTTVLFQQAATESVRSAMNGNSGIITADDYRGEKVIASFAPVEVLGTRWAIVAKKDAAEAYAPIVHLRNIIIVISLGSIMAMIAVGIAVTGSILKPIERLAKAAERVGHGDFSVRMDHVTNDEIGELANAFNIMSEELQHRTVTRDYFDNIVNSIGEAIIVVSLGNKTEGGGGFKISGTNIAANTVLGYGERDILGAELKILFFEPDDYARFAMEGEKAVAEKKQIRAAKYHLKTKAGGRLPVLFSASPLLDISGEVRGLVCAAEDITELAHTEELLREKEANLESVEEMAHLGGWKLNVVTREMTWSAELFRIFGFSPGSFRPTIESFMGCVRPDERKYVNDSLESVAAGNGMTLEFRIIPSTEGDGNEKILLSRIEPKRSPDGTLLYLAGTALDVTEERQTEYKHELAKLVFENAIEGVLVTNREAKIEFVNKAFTDITGFTSEEAIGKKPNILKSDRHGRDFYIDLWKSLATTGRWDGEIWNRRKSGEAYLQKMSITAIKNPSGRVRQYISVFHDVTDVRQSEEKLYQRENFDALTNLPNRSLFMDRLAQSVSFAEKDAKRLAVAIADLDLFKRVNETLGHAAGDVLLQLVAARFGPFVPKDATLARLGGDEFALLIPDIENIEIAVSAVHHFLSALNEPFSVGGEEIVIKSSVGMTFYPEDGKTAEALIRNAEIALNRMKTEGRDGYRLFTLSMNEHVEKRLRLENAIRRGIDNLEFVPYYQPKIDVHSGKIMGMEALARWYRPEEGVVSPSEFIPIAEETGMVVQIGEQILLEACKKNKEWLDAGFDLTVAVNLSARQFTQEGLIPAVALALSQTGLPSDKLELEITESAVMTDHTRAIALLDQLREMGVKISLDDFGTGYSSLNYLKKFPLDKLKIDQSFVRDMHRNPEDMKIVQAIISLAKGLGLRVVAEGAELSEHMLALAKAGCDEIQGYFLSRPMQASEFIRFVERHKAKHG